MNEHDCENQITRTVSPGVTTHPCVMSGTPCIAGTRIDTQVIIAQFVYGKWSVAKIAREYRIRASEVEDALRYEYLLKAKRQRRPRARLRHSRKAKP